jgi:hypothetical protein
LEIELLTDDFERLIEDLARALIGARFYSNVDERAAVPVSGQST